MIFLLLVGFFGLIFWGLTVLDGRNLDAIKGYLEDKNCTNLSYGGGRYKALCPKEVLWVENSVTLDIEKNQKSINYDTIVSTQEKNRTVILTLKNKDQVVLEFKNEEEAKAYDKKIQEKI